MKYSDQMASVSGLCIIAIQVWALARVITLYVLNVLNVLHQREQIGTEQFIAGGNTLIEGGGGMG